MNIGMNANWARFKRHGIANLGRAGFADWLDHAAQVVRAEAKREAANAGYLAQTGEHVRLITTTTTSSTDSDRGAAQR